LTVAPIPFYEHDLGEEELNAVAQVLRGPILTTGEAVENFERTFSEYLNVDHVLGVTSCTGALHISLLALGVGPGDEVITTPMTFIASSTAIIEAGAKPVFVDVESTTGNLDANRVEAAITPHTKAILPVHLYGQMCDMKHIRSIADRHNLFVVEDAAHCIEGKRDGIGPGQLGDTACFSFYATKNITCGEGGAIATRRKDLAQKLRLLRHHGMTKTAADREKEGYTHWDMVGFGWKYNMDNIQAALLLPQCKRIADNLAKRRTLAEAYRNQLKGTPGLGWPESAPNSEHARHLFTIWVSENRRDSIILALQAAGIGATVNYRAIHLLTYFKETFGFKRGDYPNAENIEDATISLPLYPKLPLDAVYEVTDSLKSIIND